MAVALRDEGKSSGADDERVNTPYMTTARMVARATGEPPHFFGAALKGARLSVFERRLTRLGPSASAQEQRRLLEQPRRFTVDHVVKLLRDELPQEERYEISLPTLSAIENGDIFPRESERFIKAVAKALDLSTGETRDLAQRLAFDLVYARFGDLAFDILDFNFNPSIGDLV
jgi:hypothetical protein